MGIKNILTDLIYELGNSKDFGFNFMTTVGEVNC